MNFEDLFDGRENVVSNLLQRGEVLEQQVTKLSAEVKTYQFLITRILVEQREMSDRISELEHVCASIALSGSLTLRRNRDSLPS